MSLVRRFSKSAIVCAVAVAGFLAPTEGKTVTLAENPWTNFGGGNSNFSFFVGAENFSLSQSATVNELTFHAVRQFESSSTVVLNSIDWYLYADSNPTNGVFGLPGSTLASGMTSSFSTTLVGILTINTYYKVAFSIPNVGLGPGDYWVGFHINDTATSGTWGYWTTSQTGDGLSARSSDSGWLTPYSNPNVGVVNMAFQVNGDLNAVPIPAALPLFATGLGLMGLLGWRQKRKDAAAVAA